jgi:hypothetical protein
MRLIDADEARKNATIDLIAHYIDRLASVDAVPVVRCKDCEYSYESIGYFICSHGVCCECIVQPDFYCAEGKRKEGEP